ncbi:MAG TPA: heparan-alpha-glucosaminide N-acetyltransferase domain-containing protein [Chryseosolibacter sp.]|nr:heparan-alpha-glucosaminide N-acetyltransferase domain-containing protein [Chryseosolibacter sp.]
MTTATLSRPIPTDLATDKARISSIDLVRGIVMVIMALDHSRDYFHLGAFNYNPTDLTTTYPALFFTRWITHYCAPAFVFLAGTSIYISSRKKSKQALSMFLLTRGLWLIVLEVVVIRFSFLFNFYYDVTFLQVIWVIGAAMVCMSALIHLPYMAILSMGAVLLIGHNATDGIQLNPGETGFALWAFIHQSGFVEITPGHSLFVVYPLIPWLAIMMLGYCIGRMYEKTFDPTQRLQILTRLGVSAILLFIVLRFSNFYGDPAPWSEQKNMTFTLMSFLNTTKYPPSLLYSLMTLGPVLLLLAAFEKYNVGNTLKPFLVFGRVPLFYYILHFFLIHAISLVLFMNKTGRSFSEIDFHFSQSFGGITGEGGYSLGLAYLGWMAVVIALYPLCKWYNRYKSTHSHWWLSYL